MTRLIQTSIRNTPFKDCKCVGLQFQKVTEVIIGITFDTCLLNLASFYKLKLKKAQFLNTNLHEVDFTETDLTLALFENCDLARATFDNTLLEGADLRTAYNYTIDPVRNKIRGARFSLPAVVGLLGAYDIEIT